jgi:hypothetical protein
MTLSAACSRGFADSPVVWVEEVRDVMITQLCVFSSEKEAQAAFAAQAAQTPNPGPG